jgi:uncharacterized protein
MDDDYGGEGMSNTERTPRMEEVLEALRAFLIRRGDAYGLQALGCFGSVARMEATAESDVDVVYRVTPSARLTLFDLALLREELMKELGRPVDLIEYRDEMPARLRERVKREAVYA